MHAKNALWQDDQEGCELVSEDEAKDLILNKAILTGWAGLSDYDIETIEAKWPNLFEEDA